MPDIERSYRRLTTTIPNGAAVPITPIDFREFAGGTIEMPAAWTAASIGFQVSSQETDTPQPLYDANGNLVQISGPTADNRYALPADLFGAHYVWLWSQDGAGSGTNQGGDRAIVVALKG